MCRSFLRGRKAELLSLEALLGGISSDTLLLFDPVPDPQEVAERRELHSLVLRAISGLSEKDRAATLLFYYEQLSLQEIAVILGISVVAVKGRLHKSRKQLRERLSPVYADMQQQGQSIEQGRISMVKVKIAAVLKNLHNDNWVVVLLDEEKHRVLNIWIEEVFERCGLALPEGKTVQVPYGLHVMRQQLDEMFRSPSKAGLTEEQIEQAEQQFIAFLTGEQETPE